MLSFNSWHAWSLNFSWAKNLHTAQWIKAEFKQPVIYNRGGAVRSLTSTERISNGGWSVTADFLQTEVRNEGDQI